MNARPFVMEAASLISKWGFADGAAFEDWWEETFDEPAPENHDEILYALVTDFLMPAVHAAGCDGEAILIGTVHNPVRLATTNGQELYLPAGPSDHPSVIVEVHCREVMAAVRRLALQADADRDSA
jgi:hypothetical protein